MRAVHHVGITVRDLERSVEFYQELLGLTFAVPPTPWFEGDHLARGLGVKPPVALRVALFEVGDGATWFEILQYRTPPSTTRQALPQSDIGAAHVAFYVDDIAAKYAELTAKGPLQLGAQHGRRWTTGRVALGVLQGSRRPHDGARGGRVRPPGAA